MLTSDDVIHSFWVPELNGKLDLNPEQTNALVIQADAPGEYRGQCAEFCGIQHAKMALLVVAEPPDAYAAWVTQQQQDAPAPLDEQTEFGQQVFLGSACVYCHTVRGTNASGVLGPDLTHLASRRTLAAATTPNTRGHLAGWIVDPQGIKPGNKMPPTDLAADELQALLVYLESLQ
jgi:cytochrome c oxidase subunit 2